MKSYDIISALCYMGDTEGTGVVETPANPKEIKEWLADTFGEEYVASGKELKPSTDYVYSYTDELYCGKHLPFETKLESEDESSTDIFLYEVE